MFWKWWFIVTYSCLFVVLSLLFIRGLYLLALSMYMQWRSPCSRREEQVGELTETGHDPFEREIFSFEMSRASTV